MREQLSDKLENGRIRHGVWATTAAHGPYGIFVVQGPCGYKLEMIAHPGHDTGWERVSIITCRRRCPNWQEMCFAKDLFWDEEERVIQYHPPLSQYVKNSSFRLHLWKPKHETIPAPPPGLIGIPGLDPTETEILINEISAHYGAKDASFAEKTFVYTQHFWRLFCEAQASKATDCGAD